MPAVRGWNVIVRAEADQDRMPAITASAAHGGEAAREPIAEQHDCGRCSRAAAAR